MAESDAIKRGLSHQRVSSAVTVVNLLLVILALASVAGGNESSRSWVPWLALGAAVALVALFLRWLVGPRTSA